MRPLMNRQVLLGAEGLSAPRKTTTKGLHAQVDSLVRLQVALSAERLAAGVAQEGAAGEVRLVAVRVITTTTTTTLAAAISARIGAGGAASAAHSVVGRLVRPQALLRLEDTPTAVHLAGVLAVEAIEVANRLDAQPGDVSAAGGGAGEGARVVELEHVVGQRVVGLALVLTPRTGPLALTEVRLQQVDVQFTTTKKGVKSC